MGFRIDKLKLHSGHQNYPVLYASDNERFVGQNQHGWFRIGAANSSHLHMETDRENFYFYNSIQNAVNIKAPMYYDINNTAFYVNPASTSNLNNVTVEGALYLNSTQETFFTGTTARKVYGTMSASGAQARRYHVARLYTCSRHWDTTWMNIDFKLKEESYNASSVDYKLIAYYNGTNSQPMALNVRELEGQPSDTQRYKLVKSSPTAAGWDHSGQPVYYTDVYLDLAYYKQVSMVVDCNGHGHQSTNPTSGAAITVLYDNPSPVNISDFTDSKNTTYTSYDTAIWNEDNLTNVSQLTNDSGYLTSLPSHTHSYLPLTGGTLTGSTILKGKSYLDGSHGDARFQIRRQDTTTESEKSYLTLWASEPGITHSSAGIGGNINSSGQYYGRQSTGAGWGAYLRFNVASGHNEFWSTTGNPGAGAGAGSKTFYVDGSGNSYAVTSSRAPIFYDSNDTAFYVNPAGTSRMSRIEISSTYYLTLGADISLNANGSVRGEYFVGSKAATNGYTVYKGYDNYNHFLAIRGYARPNQGKNKSSVAGGHQTSFVEYAEANSTTGWFFMSSSGTNYEQVAKITKSHSEFVSSVHSPRFYDLDDTTYYVRPGDISYINSLDIDSSLDVLGNTYTVGLISSAASMRAPIFYDTNNTNYYMNPHAVSNVVTIQSNSGDSFISKLSGTKSWLKHITIGALVFAPSASNNGSDWSWANEVRFSSNGTITSNGHITRSDERLKTKITDLPCDNIDVAWKSYELKSDEGEKRVGVIAQELEETHPEFVITDSEGFKSVKYIDLLIAKIAELEARLEKLEQ